MAETSKSGAARFSVNLGHQHAYTKIGSFSSSSPWLPVSESWTRVYLTNGEIEGLTRYYEEKPGRYGTTIRRKPNVWCRAEILALTGVDESEEAIVDAMKILPPFCGDASSIMAHLRNNCPARSHMSRTDHIKDTEDVNNTGKTLFRMDQILPFLADLAACSTVEDIVLELDVYASESRVEDRAKGLMGVFELIRMLGVEIPDRVRDDKKEALKIFAKVLHDEEKLVTLIPRQIVHHTRCIEFIALMKTLSNSKQIRSVLSTLPAQTSTHRNELDERLNLRHLKKEMAQTTSFKSRSEGKELSAAEVCKSMARILWNDRKKEQQTTLSFAPKQPSKEPLCQSGDNRTLQIGAESKHCYAESSGVPAFQQFFDLWDKVKAQAQHPERKRSRSNSDANERDEKKSKTKIIDSTQTTASHPYEDDPKTRLASFVRDFQSLLMSERPDTDADIAVQLCKLATTVAAYAIHRRLTVSVRDVLVCLLQLPQDKVLLRQARRIKEKLADLDPDEAIERLHETFGQISPESAGSYVALIIVKGSTSAQRALSILCSTEDGELQQQSNARALKVIAGRLKIASERSSSKEVAIGVYPGTTTVSFIARTESTKYTHPTAALFGPTLRAVGLLNRNTFLDTPNPMVAQLVSQDRSSKVVRVGLFERKETTHGLARFQSLASARELIAHALFDDGSLPSLAVARAGDPVHHDAGDYARRKALQLGVEDGIKNMICIFSAPPPVIQQMDQETGSLSGYQIYSLRQTHQSLLNTSQFPLDHTPLPNISYVDVDPNCNHLQESPFRPFPKQCRQDFGNALKDRLTHNPQAGGVYLCMSAKVFYTLDICDNKTDQQKQSLYSRHKNTLFIASMPDVAHMQDVVWVLVSEPASIRKLGSGVVHFDSLTHGCLTAAAAAANYDRQQTSAQNLDLIFSLLSTEGLLKTAKRAARADTLQRTAHLAVNEESTLFSLPSIVELNGSGTSFNVLDEYGEFSAHVTLDCSNRWLGNLTVELIPTAGRNAIRARVVDKSNIVAKDENAEEYVNSIQEGDWLKLPDGKILRWRPYDQPSLKPLRALLERM